MRRTSSILLTFAVAASVLAATPTSVATETPMIEKRVYADGTERWVPATGPQLRSLGDPGRVVAVSEDIVVQAHGVPNDPFYG